MTRMRHAWLPLATTLFISLCPDPARADTVVQVPLDGVLDARSVTTLTNGQLVVFTLPTDGGMPMLQNAFATKAVAMMQGAPIENALPDDGHFAADARHPDVVLHFANDADPTSPQTHWVDPNEMVTFAVPAATYSKVFLFFNGAAGGTMVTATLTYADATDTKTFTVPDYYADISPSDPVIFNLAANLAKWDKTTSINEANHHNITGVELDALAGKTLNQIEFHRTADGNLVFWGATGIATSEVAQGGAGGTGGGGTGGVAGGQAGGTGGTGGTGGAAVSGGSGGAAAGSAGAPTAGAGSGGAPASGGSGGAPAGAGTATSAAGSGVAASPSSPASDGGCSCHLGRVGSGAAGSWGLGLLLSVFAVLRRRRR